MNARFLPWARRVAVSLMMVITSCVFTTAQSQELLQISESNVDDNSRQFQLAPYQDVLRAENANLLFSWHQLFKLRAAYFENANAYGVWFYLMSVQEAHFENANMELAGMAMFEAPHAHFENANMVFNRMSQVNFQSSHFENWNGLGSGFSYVKLKGSHLENLNGVFGQIEFVDLQGANLFGAKLYHALIRNTDLSGCNLDWVDLRRAKLIQTNWREIQSIQHCNIWGVDSMRDGFREWALDHGAVEIQYYKDWEAYKKTHRVE